MRRSTRIDGSAGGEPLSCGNQSTYNRVANAGNLHRLSPFQMPFGILHNLTGKSSLTFSIEKCHFITAIQNSYQYNVVCQKWLVSYNDTNQKTREEGTEMPEVRLITPITRQSTKKMQVAAYCRVSSNSADQLNSYAAQIRAYKKCIGARDDWELVDIFADEGLTGMKSETRNEFQRMIRMCELKQIDLIITKSISRFARNTKDALTYEEPISNRDRFYR